MFKAQNKKLIAGGGTRLSKKNVKGKKRGGQVSMSVLRDFEKRDKKQSNL